VVGGLGDVLGVPVALAVLALLPVLGLLALAPLLRPAAAVHEPEPALPLRGDLT
jgi:hypothetical protein